MAASGPSYSCSARPDWKQGLSENHTHPLSSFQHHPTVHTRRTKNFDGLDILLPGKHSENGHVQLVTCRGVSQTRQTVILRLRKRWDEKRRSVGLSLCRWQTFNLHAQLASLSDPTTTKTTQDYFSLVKGVIGSPKTLRAGTITKESSDYESLFRSRLHSSPSVFHFPPGSLSLPFFFSECNPFPSVGFSQPREGTTKYQRQVQQDVISNHAQ